MYPKEKNFQFVHLETECQPVVVQLANRQNVRSVGAQVFREMGLLISNLPGFKLCFFRREASNVAHVCGKHCLGLSSSAVSFEDIPGVLIEPVQSEIRLSL